MSTQILSKLNPYLNMADKSKYKKRIEELIAKRNETLLEEQAVQEIIDLYEPAFDKQKSLWDRILAFLRAENELGRKFGRVLDIIGSKKINTARDFVRERILPHL